MSIRSLFRDLLIATFRRSPDDGDSAAGWHLEVVMKNEGTSLLQPRGIGLHEVFGAVPDLFRRQDA
jgi:hypothetical protein